MSKMKFIRLHNTENNTVCIVNVEHITIIDTDEYEGRIASLVFMDSTTNINEFKVNESPEKIYSMIEEMNK